MAFAESTLLNAAETRLAKRSPTDYMVLESRLIIAWKLGKIELAEELATSYNPNDDSRADVVKDLLARMRRQVESPTDLEVFEPLVTAACDTDACHPDKWYEDFVPECDGEEPCRWD